MSDFIGWDDVIESDGNEFTVLMPGKYIGTVSKIERKVSESAGKMNGCRYAEIGIAIDGGGYVSDKLFLAKSMEWKIGMFLGALGLKKKGEPIQASKIFDAEGKKVEVTIGCKGDKDAGYCKYTAEEAQAAIDNDLTVYNEVKGYAPVKEQAQAAPAGGIDMSAFGF